MRDNKTLFITGASSDVGLALIEAVADNYGLIVAHYRSSADRLQPLKDSLGDKLMLVQADFSQPDSVQAMLGQLRDNNIRPDHVVHLAAAPSDNLQFRKVDWEAFSRELQCDLRPIVDILGDFLPFMSKQKYGKVIFMLTSCTVGMPPKFKSTYTTSKYALLGLMRSLAVEYADKGITVNGVSPEMIETRFLDNVPDLIKEANAASMPQGRNLTVDQVVPTFAYLLSDGADMVSGQNIAITDGK